MVGGGHTVPRRTEVQRDATKNGQESLRCTDRAEPFHRPFALPGRLMGVLAAIVQVFVLPVRGRRHSGPVRDLVAAEFVGDQHPRRVTLVFEEYAEEPGRSLTVPLALDQYVEHGSVLIDSPPQIFSDSADLDEDFVEVPPITSLGCPPPQSAGVFGPEPGAPGTDRFVGHLNPTVGHE